MGAVRTCPTVTPVRWLMHESRALVSKIRPVAGVGWWVAALRLVLFALSLAQSDAGAAAIFVDEFDAGPPEHRLNRR
jgi:hypothetical protein